MEKKLLYICSETLIPNGSIVKRNPVVAIVRCNPNFLLTSKQNVEMFMLATTSRRNATNDAKRRSITHMLEKQVKRKLKMLSSVLNANLSFHLELLDVKHFESDNSEKKNYKISSIAIRSIYLTTLTHKVSGTLVSCGVAHSRKGLISVFHSFLLLFILAGGLGTRLLFYVVPAVS